MASCNMCTVKLPLRHEVRRRWKRLSEASIVKDDLDDGSSSSELELEVRTSRRAEVTN